MSGIAAAEQRVADFVSAISAPRVSPGAGAAGAVTLALAAACAGKAASISLKHSPEDAELSKAVAGFEELARLALLEAERDAAAFEGFVKEKSPRATVRLIEEGDYMASLIDRLLSALGAVRVHIADNMSGDLVAAAALARAARVIQKRNESEARDALLAELAQNRAPTVV